MRLLAASLAIATILIAPSAAEAATAATGRPLAIEYRVRRVPAGDRYEITLRFRGDHNGRSTLTIPSEWASATHAERGIEGLAVITRGARLEDTDAPQTRRIVHRPDAMLTVRYVLKQIADGEPAATARTQYLPVIQRTYFEWIGWTTWVIPLADNRRLVRVHAVFEDLPPDWAFASSYGLDPAAVDFEGPMDRFQSALFLGGDFRLRSRPARGGPVVTAMRGAWTFGDNAFADRVATIVDAERAFWKDVTQRYYLIALVPLVAEPRQRSIVGTGLTQSFVTFSTTGMAIEGLDFLWTHEYFHNWNNQQLGKFPDPEAQLYWFSEGFTDYYMNMLQLRLGLMSLEQYAKAYDNAIAFLAESPEGHAPNSEIVKRFFTDGNNIGRLPYARGMLLAARWDAEIRTASGDKRSLDDAMRTLYAQHRRGVDVLDASRIIAVVQSYGVRDAASDIDRQIERGELPRLANDVLTSCISIADVTARADNIGFDLAGSTSGGPIVGVDPAGPAYAAGMRNGQALRSFLTVDRAQHLVEAGFQDDPQSEIRKVRYLALGPEVMRQSTVVRSDLDDATRRRCTTALGTN